MTVQKCLEVIVKFVSPSKQGVAIRTAHGDSRTRYLRVEQTAERLTISFCDKDDEVVGSINYNYAEVFEWATEGWVK